jgi:hypothetical protein
MQLTGFSSSSKPKCWFPVTDRGLILKKFSMLLVLYLTLAAETGISFYAQKANSSQWQVWDAIPKYESGWSEDCYSLGGYVDISLGGAVSKLESGDSRKALIILNRISPLYPEMRAESHYVKKWWHDAALTLLYLQNKRTSNLGSVSLRSQSPFAARLLR